jgi:hypothetical protein
MRLFWTILAMLGLLLVIWTPSLFSAEVTHMTLEKEKPILVILLASEPGIPAGYLDASTRPDATEMCNHLIATQSKSYATPVSRSRCIIKVQE